MVQARGATSCWPNYSLIQSNPLEILPRVVAFFLFGSRSTPELSSLWSHTFFGRVPPFGNAFKLLRLSRHFHSLLFPWQVKIPNGLYWCNNPAFTQRVLPSHFEMLFRKFFSLEPSIAFVRLFWFYFAFSLFCHIFHQELFTQPR